MTIRYVNNSCFDDATSPVSHSIVDPWGSSQCAPDAHMDSLPIADASACASGLIPLTTGTDFSMSRLFELPNAIVVDFRNDQSMSTTLDRISDYVENRGRCSIISATQYAGLAGLTGDTDEDDCGLAAGHDLRLSDVAQFYNTVSDSGETLLDGERELLSQLTQRGFLVRRGNGRYESSGLFALTGISRSMTVDERVPTFIHELSHMRYMLDEIFRERASMLWNRLGPRVQQLFRGALTASGNYSSGETWLLETETQAYAIAPTESADGLVNPLVEAAQQCADPSRSLSPSCRDFLAFSGNLRQLLDELHYKYFDVSQHEIPLLAGWRLVNGVVTPSSSITCPPPTDQDETEKCRTWMESLQQGFDSYHRSPCGPFHFDASPNKREINFPCPSAHYFPPSDLNISNDGAKNVAPETARVKSIN